MWPILAWIWLSIIPLTSTHGSKRRVHQNQIPSETGTFGVPAVEDHMENGCLPTIGDHFLEVGKFSIVQTLYALIISKLKGSAWEYDSKTDEFYLHLFAKEQADLNWDHAPLRQAIQNMMEFWLKRGSDGFRVRIANAII